MEQKNENIILSMMEKFTWKEDSRDWMKKPFNAAGKTVSTNGIILIAAPIQCDFPDFTDKCKGVYPKEHNMKIEISLSDLKNKLSLLKMVDCYDQVNEECDACNGEGEVIFEFRHTLKDYELEWECPICEGEGTVIEKGTVPNGKKEYDEHQLIKIGNSYFNPFRLDELI